jgi:hypothetical protein
MWIRFWPFRLETFFSAVDPDPYSGLDLYSMGSGYAIRIRIQEAKNDPQTLNKFHFLECWSWMFSFEG